MTREEAIKILTGMQTQLWDVREIDEALDMAIEALQELPKRRKEVKRWKRKALKAEPRSVSRWIDADLDPDFAKCEKCSKHKVDIAYSKDFIKQESWNFCPYCGAKMNKEIRNETNRR